MTETMKKYTLQILKIFAILKYVLVEFKIIKHKRRNKKHPHF